jgi:hypothetical protein
MCCSDGPTVHTAPPSAVSAIQDHSPPVLCGSILGNLSCTRRRGLAWPCDPIPIEITSQAKAELQSVSGLTLSSRAMRALPCHAFPIKPSFITSTREPSIIHHTSTLPRSTSVTDQHLPYWHLPLSGTIVKIILLLDRRLQKYRSLLAAPLT